MCLLYRGIYRGIPGLRSALVFKNLKSRGAQWSLPRPPGAPRGGGVLLQDHGPRELPRGVLQHPREPQRSPPVRQPSARPTQDCRAQARSLTWPWTDLL